MMSGDAQHHADQGGGVDAVELKPEHIESIKTGDLTSPAYLIGLLNASRSSLIICVAILLCTLSLSHSCITLT